MKINKIDNILIFNRDKLINNNGWKESSNIFKFGDCKCVLNDNEVLLSKNWFSQTTIYYYYVNGSLIVADNWLKLVHFLQHNTNKLSIDTDYIWLYLQFQTPLTYLTFSSEIKYLRSGEIVSFKNNSINSKFNELRGPETNIKEFHLRKQLKSNLSELDLSKTAFHLSSGLDSSILAILAKETNSSYPINLATCRTRASGCSDEIENVKKLSKSLDGNLIIFDFLDIDVFKEGQEMVENCLGYPIAHPSHLVEFLLDKHLSKNFDTIVTGKGPDECLGGYPWHLKKYSDPNIHRERLTVTQPTLLSEILKVESLSSELFYPNQGHMSLSDRLKYDLLSISESWNIIGSSIANYFNINIVSPFLNSTLREKMYFLPDSSKIKDVKGKIFMREHFWNDYPDYILDFAKRGLRLDLKPYFDDYSCEEIYEKINYSSEFIEKHFNPKMLQTMILETKHNIHNYGWQIWGIYLMSCSAKYLGLK